MFGVFMQTNGDGFMTVVLQTADISCAALNGPISSPVLDKLDCLQSGGPKPSHPVWMYALDV